MIVSYLFNRGVDKDKKEFLKCYNDAEEGQNSHEIEEELGYNETIELLKLIESVAVSINYI